MKNDIANTIGIVIHRANVLSTKNSITNPNMKNTAAIMNPIKNIVATAMITPP